MEHYSFLFLIFLGIKLSICWFVNHGNPWFQRGSGFSRGLGAGVFMFTNTYGHANGDNSFRVVLFETKK